MKRHVTVPFFISHQGCPHRCVFCDQATISGSEGAIPSASDLAAAIDTFRASSGNSSVDVAFFGGSFTALPWEIQDSLLLPLQPFVAAGTVRNIRVSTRPDAIVEAEATYLKERRVSIVELGAQSLDDEVLCGSGRGHVAADVTKAVGILRNHIFSVGLQLMVGLPGDTPRRYRDSLTRAIELRPDFLRIYPTLVIAGTELEMLFRDGRYVPLSLDEAVSICAETLRMAFRQGIPVIRVGLQATDDLCAPGRIVAGPYHPAFRQLVESRLCFDVLASLVIQDKGPVTVRCAPQRLSDVAGQRRSNISRLLADRGVVVDRIEVDPFLDRMELEVECRSGRRRGHIMDVEVVNG